MVCSVASFAQSGATPADVSGATENLFPANTRPSDRRSLSLLRPSGRSESLVRHVHVQPMGKAAKGQVLLEVEDREEQLNQKIMKLEAESQVEIQQAVVTRDNKAVELDRLKQMKDAAAPQEIERARLELELANLAIDKAKMEHEQRKLALERQNATLDNMRIVCPFDGVVEDVLVREGEIIDPSKGAVIVVRNDPLWVEVHLPVSFSQKLKIGQPLAVVYPDDPQQYMGKIIYFNPFADAASGTQMLRLELPNPQGRPSGLQVQVQVPPSAQMAELPKGN